MPSGNRRHIFIEISCIYITGMLRIRNRKQETGKEVGSLMNYSDGSPQQ